MTVYSKQRPEPSSGLSCCQGSRCTDGTVTDVAVSPDERRLVIAGPATCVFALPDLRKLSDLAASSPVGSVGKGVAFSPLGSPVARAAGNEVELLDLSPNGSLSFDAARVRWNVHLLEVARVAFHPRGWEVASGGERTKASLGTGGDPPPALEPINLFDVANGKRVRVLQGNAAAIERLGYSPTGKHLVSLDHSGGLLLFPTRTSPATKVASNATAFAFTNDETLLVGTQSGEVIAFDTLNNSRSKLTDLGEPVTNVAATSRGTVAVQGESGRIVMRSASGSERQHGVSGALRGGLAFAPNGTLAVLPETGKPQWLPPPGIN